MKFFGHFKTITKHKLLVMKHCFRIGLYRQGLAHDMSKYHPREFMVGVKYYIGTESPNSEERKATGVSTAWLRHKGRNKHHFEYWIDYSVNPDEGFVGMKMPLKYVAEMFCDRLAASKNYQGAAYTSEHPLTYYLNGRDKIIIHPEVDALLIKLLTMLKDEGEDATFTYLKQLLKEEKKNQKSKKNGSK
ncbi:MAG: catalase [Clostridia bacterium]|nr:catalase [Clostridia bacterium]